MKISNEKAAQLEAKANGQVVEGDEEAKRNSMLAQMDADAKLAIEDLGKLDQTAVKAVAKWYAIWYVKAGHKRLGRHLAKIGK